MMNLDTILKALGINPEEIKKPIAEMQQIMTNIANSLREIQATQARHDFMLKTLLNEQFGELGGDRQIPDQSAGLSQSVTTGIIDPPSGG